MKIILAYNEEDYQVDLSTPIDLSIPIGDVKCFHAPDPTFTPYTSGDFIGSVSKGAPVNFYNVFFNPHGNGTHTESLGHITKKQESVNNFESYHFVSQLLSVGLDRKKRDRVLRYDEIKGRIIKGIPALILRTKPNLSTKLKKDYSDSNPPYIDAKAMRYIAEMGIQHLLVDLPSVDREVDKGILASHHAFWKVKKDKADKYSRKEATITELIFVDNRVKDGLYLLNLQLPAMELDAVPSRPVLYKMVKSK